MILDMLPGLVSALFLHQPAQSPPRIRPTVESWRVLHGVLHSGRGPRLIAGCPKRRWVKATQAGGGVVALLLQTGTAA